MNIFTKWRHLFQVDRYLANKHSPIGQIVVIVVVIKALAKYIRITQVTRLEVAVSSVQAFDELAA